MATIQLPWPPPTLSPNRRQHWSRLAKAKARYRMACHLVVEMRQGDRIPSGDLSMDVMFYPPDRRSYDRDNLLARLKAGIDGMCDALGIDDSRFVTTTVGLGPPVKNYARVDVTIGKANR